MKIVIAGEARYIFWLDRLEPFIPDAGLTEFDRLRSVGSREEALRSRQDHQLRQDKAPRSAKWITQEDQQQEILLLSVLVEETAFIISLKSGLQELTGLAHQFKSLLVSERLAQAWT